MAALLAADAAAVFRHILIHILVAHGGLGIVNALLIKSLVQAEVGHNGGDDRVGDKLAALLHIAAIDVQDMVTGDDIALFIHAEAAVGIAVIGKADVKVILDNELLQPLNVGGAGVEVDVQAVGLIVDDIGVGAQCVKDALGNVPAGAVGAVQTDLDAAEGVDAQADQVPHIAVAACHIVHSAAHMVAAGKGQLRPVLIENVQLAVEVILDQQQRFLVHLLAVAVNELDTVVIVGVVAGRDHDAAVEIVHAGDVGNARGGGDMQQVGIGAAGGQARDKAILKHVGAAAGILADDDARGSRLAVALAQHAVVPAQKTADLVGVIGGQRDAGLPTEAVSAKIFSHNKHLSLQIKVKFAVKPYEAISFLVYHFMPPMTSPHYLQAVYRCSIAVQPSSTSRQVAEKSPVYHGSATSPGWAV